MRSMNRWWAALFRSQKVRGDDENSDWETAASQFYLQFSKYVEDFFDESENLSVINALAQYIAGRRRLTGFEVVDFLETIWEGPLPQKAKPANEHSTGFHFKY